METQYNYIFWFEISTIALTVNSNSLGEKLMFDISIELSTQKDTKKLVSFFMPSIVLIVPNQNSSVL